MGARIVVPDPSVHPVCGQHVFVENPGIDTFFIEAPLGPRWASFVRPRRPRRGERDRRAGRLTWKSQMRY
jgi:D-amino-acid oxidase